MYNVDKPEFGRKFRRANPIEIPKDVLESILKETISPRLKKIIKKTIKRNDIDNESLVFSLFKILQTDAKKYIELIRDYTGISYKEVEAEYMSSEYIKKIKKDRCRFQRNIRKRVVSFI